MLSNNEYYKLILEKLTGDEIIGNYNDTYYLKRIAEHYNITYSTVKCKGKYLKDIVKKVVDSSITGSHPNNYYLRRWANYIMGEKLPWMTENYYLKRIYEYIDVTKTSTNLLWLVPPTNVVYSDKFLIQAFLVKNGGVPIEGATVRLMIGSYMVGEDVTNSRGEVTITGSPIRSGRHKFTLEYDGSVEYRGCENSVDIDVAKETSYMNITGESVFYTGEDVIVTGTLIDNDTTLIKGRTVKITEDGTVIGTGITNNNGAFSITVPDLVADTYNWTLVFEDDDYTGNSESLNIHVIDPYISLSADNEILSYADGDSAILTATLHGVDVAGKTVEFYNVTSDELLGTAVSDSDGVAVCPVPYESQGVGDVTFEGRNSMFLIQTFSIQDCFNAILTEQSFSYNGIQTITDNVPNLANIDFELEFDFKCSDTNVGLCLGDTTYKSTRQNRMSMGKYDNVVFQSWVSTSTSLNNNGASLDGNYHTFKLVREGSNVKGYCDDVLIATQTPPFLNVTTWSIYVYSWEYLSYSIKNIKLKPL